MKYWIWAYGILIVSVLSSRSFAVQREEHLLQVISEKIGSLHITATIQDRGIVQQGEILSFQFPYKVVGDGPVKILGIHQECGCLISSLRAGMVLERGSTGVLKVEANTSHFEGTFDKKITILTSESEKTPHILRVRAKIQRSVVWSPALVELDLRGNATSPSKVTITNHSKQRLHIEKLDYNKDNLEVVHQAHGEGWVLEVRWKGAPPAGPWAEAIEVTTNGTVKSFRIPVVERSPTKHAKRPTY
jgi:hypothetical protein